MVQGGSEDADELIVTQTFVWTIVSYEYSQQGCGDDLFNPPEDKIKFLGPKGISCMNLVNPTYWTDVDHPTADQIDARF